MLTLSLHPKRSSVRSSERRLSALFQFITGFLQVTVGLQAHS
jgi:hypothetical protein